MPKPGEADVQARSSRDDAEVDAEWRGSLSMQERDDTPTDEESGPLDARSDAAWLAEIERRARAALAGEPGIPWEQVRREFQLRFGAP